MTPRTHPQSSRARPPSHPSRPGRSDWSDWPLRPSDWRGLARLGTDAVVAVTDVVEQMHHTIARGTGIVGKTPVGPTRGITGFVYRCVRGTTRLVGVGLDAGLSLLGPPSGAGTPGQEAPSNAQRDALLAVLNGVWGDRLAATGNPLAVPMRLRVQGRALVLPEPGQDTQAPGLAEQLAALDTPVTGRVLVLLHGLCMNDRQWLRNGHDHGRMLAETGGFTPLYLHYNSGRHISQNGREFAGLLERLLAAWPVPVQELVLIGHSMGGLVARSACFCAQEGGLCWPQRLTRLACLGSPHHGARLERGGHLIDTALGLSPYAAPIGRLGRARSAGITDLRFGNLQDADWQGRDAHAQRRDDRRPTPLPAGVDVLLLAAGGVTEGARRHVLGDGDGLVPLDSALGRHADPALALQLPETHRVVLAGLSHFDLLDSAEVAARLRSWLGLPQPPATIGSECPSCAD